MKPHIHFNLKIAQFNRFKRFMCIHSDFKLRLKSHNGHNRENLKKKSTFQNQRETECVAARLIMLIYGSMCARVVDLHLIWTKWTKDNVVSLNSNIFTFVHPIFECSVLVLFGNAQTASLHQRCRLNV